MDHHDTIPSQLGPVNTVPAALGSSGRSAPLESTGSGVGGLVFKLLLLAATVGVTLYLVG